jgi:hypothetical protein
MELRRSPIATNIHRLVVCLLLACIVSGCGSSGPTEVQVGEGDGPDGHWTAAVRSMGNALFPDERVCVRVYVQGGSTIDSGCGSIDPGSHSAEVQGNGLVFAQTSAPAATQARLEVVGRPAVVVPLGRAEPISETQWMVAWTNSFVGNVPSFSITFLDADGRQVDAIHG